MNPKCFGSHAKVLPLVFGGETFPPINNAPPPRIPSPPLPCHLCPGSNPHDPQPQYSFTVKIAMLEIYNEEVRDLLSPEGANHSNHISNHSNHGGSGLTSDWALEGGGGSSSKLEIRRDQSGVVQVWVSRRDFVCFVRFCVDVCVCVCFFCLPFYRWGPGSVPGLPSSTYGNLR